MAKKKIEENDNIVEEIIDSENTILVFMKAGIVIKGIGYLGEGCRYAVPENRIPELPEGSYVLA